MDENNLQKAQDYLKEQGIISIIPRRDSYGIQVGNETYSVEIKPEDLNRFIRENTSDYQV